MSKRTSNVKSATNSGKAKLRSARRKTPSTNAAPPMPPEAAKLIQEHQRWQQCFKSPAKRRAYIKKICQLIAEEFKPEKIILFGSHAYGQPTQDSDVDLLVVMPFDGGYFHQAARIRQHLSLPIPMDLLVRTPEQLHHRLEIGDSFMREIVERGKVMYEAHHP
jgi:predicted nucleotidyltransferase